MKFFLSLLTAFALLTVAHAQGTAQKAQEQPKADHSSDYEFFSLAFFPGVSTSPDHVNVYGVRLGAPVSFGDHSFVAGTELAVLAGMTSEIYGLQAAGLFVTANKVEGIQFSIVNDAKKVYGLQLGLINLSEDAAFQIGLVNYIKNSKVPFLPILNVCF